jgi:uncharacterized membrane protein YidH (DUF202 family)
VADRTGPDSVFDTGLQHERTALAWERTAIASMVAGILLGRYAAESLHYGLAAIGLTWVVIGSVLLVWSARHYDDLHGPLRAGQSPVHPGAVRVVGLGTIIFTGAALLLALAIAW